MNIFITNFIGFLLAIMIYLNAALTNNLGMINALLFIHIGGLVGCFIICLYKKEKIAYIKTIPFYIYLGGVLGVITVIANTYGFLTIGASLTATLGLLGQLVASIIVDVFGFMGSEKKPFSKDKIIGIIIIIVGIIMMEV